MGPFALCLVLAIALLLAIAVAVWWLLVSGDPGIDITAPAVPSPNARDLYLRAAEAIVDLPAIDRWQTATPEECWEAAMANRPARELVRQAFAYQFAETAVAQVHYSKFRKLARMLACAARAHAARSEWAEAVDAGLDCLHLAADVPHQGALIGMLVGAAVDVYAAGTLSEAVEHLGASEARQAARRLEGINARQVTFAEVMESEKRFMLAALRDGMRSPWYRLKAPRGAAILGWRGSLRGMVRTALMSNRRIAERTAAQVDAVAARSAGSFGARSALRPRDDPFAESIAGCSDAPWFRYLVWRARDGLLLAALGLQAYRAEHGAHPDRLDALVPAILSRVPADPFQPSTPLRYRREGEGIVLYSVGPDGKDDGGTPIANPLDSGWKPWAIGPESVGDMVYGVNDAFARR